MSRAKTIPLSESQERFCREYIIDFNGKKAAIRAGYSEKTAYSAGSRLLQRPQVIAFIDHLQKKLAERHDISIDKIVQELAKIGFANIRDYINDENEPVNLLKLPPHKTAAVDSVEKNIRRSKFGKDNEVTESTTKIRLHDKLGALDKLLRHLGGYNDKLQIMAPDIEVILPQMLKERGNQTDPSAP